jgi:hypothetical protein
MLILASTSSVELNGIECRNQMRLTQAMEWGIGRSGWIQMMVDIWVTYDSNYFRHVGSLISYAVDCVADQS